MVSASWCGIKDFRRAMSAPGHLPAGPAFLRDTAGTEVCFSRLRRLRVVERKVQTEETVQIRATQVEPGTYHPDLVANAKAQAASQRIRIFPIAGKFVAEAVVDDHRLAPAIEKALPAVQLRRE